MGNDYDSQGSIFDGMDCVRISHSLIDTYATCEARGYHRYWLEKKQKPVLVFAKGNGVDRGMGYGYEEVRAGRKVTAALVKDRAVHEYDLEIAKAGGADAFGGSDGDEVETPDGPVSARVTAGRDDVARLAAPMWDRIGATVRPHPDFKTQTKLETKVPGTKAKIVSYLDVIEEVKKGAVKVVRVRDTKTSGKKWAKAREYDTFQAPIYAKAVSESLRVPVTEVVFDVGAFNKRDVTIESRVVAIGPAQLKPLPMIAKAAVNAFERFARGDMPLPTAHLTGSFRCDWSSCGYAKDCEAMYGIRVKDSKGARGY